MGEADSTACACQTACICQGAPFARIASPVSEDRSSSGRARAGAIDCVAGSAGAGWLVRHRSAGLVDRVRGVMGKLRMDAPKLDGKGMGNDANTIAEYLDSALEQDRVAEFERVCLESDKHLCEVAACHQILTIVLGKPADVPTELRERVYALGDPEKAAVHVTGAASAATHDAR